MSLLLLAGAAGAAGVAGYAWAKHRQRRAIANGYVTYHDSGYGSPQYGHFHYGNTGGYRHGGNSRYTYHYTSRY